jgi:hypothetical protein
MDRQANQPTVIIKHAGLRSVGAFAAFPTNIIRNGALSIGARLTYGLLVLEPNVLPQNRPKSPQGSA